MNLSLAGINIYIRKIHRLIAGTENQHCVEKELIRGTHKNDNTHPSIIHFSFNKAATQYVKSVLVQCCTKIGMVHAGLNEYAFNSKFPYLDHLSTDEMQQYQHVFRTKGYVYSVFGGMIENIPDLGAYKVVLGVRDPRDMLVSNYFSMAFSHPSPDKKGDKYESFIKKRERARSLTIDQYVLGECNAMKDVFDRYQNLLLKRHANVYVIKYEDMVFDFDSWLTGLLNYCELEVPENLLETIKRRNEKSKPVKEDVRRHVRKGLPGDYMDKLHLETIKQLNATFLPHLEYFGYSR